MSTAFGVMLLLLVAYDVYATILHARARGGPISETLNRSVWHVVRRVAFYLPRQSRHKLLNTVGPLLLPALIVLFILLLVTGFALIYFPRMPASFVIDERTMSSPWFESLYFSGVTLTTVGYGDITPRTFEMRAVALIEGASGFALISLAVTYLISVYRALENKRAVALSFYHQAEEGADVAGFISHHFVAGRFYGLESVLTVASRDIQQLLESHVEHPIIHYFHPVEVHKSMPRMLFLELETCAVIRSCLDEGEYPETYHHPEVRTLEASARHVLGALVTSLDLERRHHNAQRTETPTEESLRWQRRFKQTIKQLKTAGIHTRPNLSEGWELYRASREEWESKLHRFASFLGYDWDEITGDSDLRYAADEEMEEPGQDSKQ
ncbi:MAG TPA: potassium channel family protein [Pyrinomonadaceae bacterium]|jgi:hypothetical protein